MCANELKGLVDDKESFLKSEIHEYVNNKWRVTKWYLFHFKLTMRIIMMFYHIFFSYFSYNNNGGDWLL